MDDEKTPPDDQESTVTVPSESLAPGRIGPYKILQKLGEGGMGVVYLAEQEHPIRRRVALKIIKLGMDTKAVIARFEAERQALAMMDHPCVAKVFDAGETPNGRPYFVMEHVQGVPITEHCDRHRLPVRERLRLFVRACEGVQHAHQKAIVHRDLKPSNVLVSIQDGKAVPKIIDFGVAKATAQKLTERTMFTELGVLVGTPEYMSPEQAEATGQNVDTRTDVYSLGVMLYELLVGALPFDPKVLRAGGYDGIRRKIREEDPERPSTRLSTLGDESTESASRRKTDLSTLRRQLRGDLDWITMRALEKDRTRRYGSPSELAADVERHLRDEPVLAGPPSVAYRAKKFVRRHRVGVAVASVAMLVLLGFAATMAVQAGRIATERDRANRERESAERVAEFLADMLGNVEPEVLGASLWRDLRGRIEEVQRGRGATDRQVEDSVARFGDVVSGVNPTDAAVRLIDEEVLARAGAAIESELEEDPRIAAQLRLTIGKTYVSLGLYDRADSYLQESLTLHESLLGPGHPDTLEARSELATLLWMRGKLDEAVGIFQEVLEGRRRVLGDGHADTLSSMDNVGSVLLVLGRLEEAEGYCVEALEGRRRTLGDDDPATLLSITNLGFLRLQQSRLDEAEALAREALEGRRRVLGNDHLHTLNSINNMGFLLQGRNRLDEAEEYTREALEGHRRVLGDDHPFTLNSVNNLGILLQNQGRPKEAEEYTRAALDGRRRILGDDHPDTLNSMSTMAGVLRMQGRLEESRTYLDQVLERRRRTLGGEHPQTVTTMENIGILFQEEGSLREAEDTFRRVLEIRRRTRLAGAASIGTALASLGGNLNLQGRYDEAEPLLRECLEIRREILPADHWFIPNTRSMLGESLAGQGEFAEAEPMLVDAYSGLQPPPKWIARKREALDRVVELYEAWGRPADAAEWRARERELE